MIKNMINKIFEENKYKIIVLVVALVVLVAGSYYYISKKNKEAEMLRQEIIRKESKQTLKELLKNASPTSYIVNYKEI
jgi:Tfp pilus assembly protein PilO